MRVSTNVQLYNGVSCVSYQFYWSIYPDTCDSSATDRKPSLPFLKSLVRQCSLVYAKHSFGTTGFMNRHDYAVKEMIGMSGNFIKCDKCEDRKFSVFLADIRRDFTEKEN